MFYQTEAKPQGWRAVAVFDDRGDRLVYLGRSSTQVRTNFGQALFEVPDDEEREHVRSISLQRWHGAPDAGRWMHQSTSPCPSRPSWPEALEARSSPRTAPVRLPHRFGSQAGAFRCPGPDVARSIGPLWGNLGGRGKVQPALASPRKKPNNER